MFVDIRSANMSYHIIDADIYDIVLDQYVRGWMDEETVAKKNNRFIVNSFCLASLYRLVWGKWLTDQIWSRYINKNHPLSDSSLVYDVMLHNTVSKNNQIKITYL